MSAPDSSELDARLSPGWRRLFEQVAAAADRPAADPARLAASMHLLPAGLRAVRDFAETVGRDDATAAVLVAAPSTEALARWVGADRPVNGARPSDAAVAAAMADAPLEALERTSLVLGIVRDLAELYGAGATANTQWWITPRDDPWWPGGIAPLDAMLAEGIGALRRTRALLALALAQVRDGAPRPDSWWPEGFP